MDGESHAFLNQIIEVERAIENLTRSGKLYYHKTPTNHAQGHPAQSSHYTPRHHTNQYFPRNNHSSHLSREYGGGRNGPFVHSRESEYGSASYGPPPPPLQQQYPHSQQPQGLYSRHPSSSAASLNIYDPVPQQNDFRNNENIHNVRPSSHHYSYFQQQNRMDNSSGVTHKSGTQSPFGGSTTFPPLSRLDTGSSQSTTPSVGAGMSSSMSMLPPGYGRDGYGSIGASVAHSRAHSVTGSLSGLAASHTQSVNHSRTHSITQQGDLGRTLPGNNGSMGIFEHSRAGSISGATNSPSPSAASFNFFGGPTAQSHANSPSLTSSTLGSQSNLSRIAPIGRPTIGRKNNNESSSGLPTVSNKNEGSGASQASGPNSGVTSPLSSSIHDGWLDTVPISRSGTSSTSTAVNENRRRNLQSVWND